MPSEAFAGALLSPDIAVPTGVKGRVPRRFAVYKNNVVVGLIRAMEANFPAVRRLLGEVYFAGLAREFVLQHPPRSPLMFTYGESFPAFLAAQTDLEEFPFLADVARLECLVRQAYHAADRDVLSADAMNEIQPDLLGDVVFTPHPALHLLGSHYAVVSVTQANRGDGGEEVLDTYQAEWAVVTRPHTDVLLSAVTASQFSFVQSLVAGQCLADAADEAFAGDAEFDLATTLSLVLSRGMFSTIILRTHDS